MFLQADLYHHVTVYDHIIAYARLAFVIIDMEAMLNYLAARKFQDAKWHFNISFRSVHASGCTILYFIRPHIEFIMFSVFYLYHTFGSSAIPQAC